MNAICKMPQITKSVNYQRVLRFGDKTTKARIVGYNTAIEERIEAERIESIYQCAVEHFKKVYAESACLLEIQMPDIEACRSTLVEYKHFVVEFESLTSYKDSGKYYNLCATNVTEWENKIAWLIEKQRMQEEATRHEIKRIKKRNIKIGIFGSFGLAVVIAFIFCWLM